MHFQSEMQNILIHGSIVVYGLIYEDLGYVFHEKVD